MELKKQKKIKNQETDGYETVKIYKLVKTRC